LEFCLNANDKSRLPPRLFVVQAMWGMAAWPSKKSEWPIERKLELIREAGFDAIDLDIPDVTGKEKYWEDLLSRFELKLGLQGPFIHNISELKTCINIVKRMNSPYLDAQVGTAFMTEAESRELLMAMTEVAAENEVALLIQTHRGRVTQDLLRTVNYCKSIGRLRLNLDLSHYFVAGEFGEGALPEGATQAFDVLLKHTSMIDGRVSNGHQVQIDIGSDAENPAAAHFATLWRKAMVNWLESAEPGDVFVFRPELGPPPYSMVGLDGNEISDRWEQAKVMAQLGRRLWNEAVSGKPSTTA
jgi:sugar phosphate isomerase/epimerase